MCCCILSPKRLALLLALVLALPIVAPAAVPRTLHYQGRLTDPASGDPLPGNHTVTFCLYDDSDPIAGEQLWCETQALDADGDGVIVATLGATTPLPLAFDAAYWLEVEVDGQVLLPRRAVASAAYALYAANADSLDGLDASAYATTEHAHNADTIVPDVVSSISGVSNDGGDISLEAGVNISVVPDDAANTITIGVSGGVNVPVGAVVAWLRDYAGTPAIPDGWVECDGQILDDPESPYHEQTIPDMNGVVSGNNKCYLRGSPVSGSRGGSDTHDHTLITDNGCRLKAGTDFVREDDDICWYDPPKAMSRPSFEDHNPRYYTVVWILRTK